MGNYKICYNGDRYISEVHHIAVDCEGNRYSVIFGKYTNGGFCSIPNWEVGCELADFSDKFWNTESLTNVLGKRKVAKAIAEAIAEFSLQRKEEDLQYNGLRTLNAVVLR